MVWLLVLSKMAGKGLFLGAPDEKLSCGGIAVSSMDTSVISATR